MVAQSADAYAHGVRCRAHVAVLAGKAWRRLDEGTLTPWLFGRLRVLWDWRAIVRHRRKLMGRLRPGTMRNALWRTAR